MQPSISTREFARVRQAVLLGLFAGTGVGLGYALSAVPGVELMSTNAALAGAALGPVGGIVVGIVSQTVYSLASPFGPPVPLMLLAQLVGMALAGLAGAAVGPLVRRRAGLAGTLTAGAAGVVMALVLDILTNLAVAVQFAMPLTVVFVGGAAVAALHAGTVAVSWAVLLPLLAGRLARLRRPGPQVMSLALALICLAGADPAGGAEVAPGDTLAVVVPDTTAAMVAVVADTLVLPVAAPAEERPEGWVRPLWQPFHASLEERLLRTTPWLPVRDGGPGATMVILGEPTTEVAPQLWRDGVPLGIGNRYLDDHEAWSLAGRDQTTLSRGFGSGGGMAGVIGWTARDPVPDRDLLNTTWYAGPHETRLRDLQFLTAAADWRLAFDFYEHLDREGYDFRTPADLRFAELDDELSLEFWGNTAIRSGRGRIERRLDDGSRVALSLENARKTKHGVAVSDLEEQKIWRNAVQLRWQAGRPADRSEASLWWTDTDLLAEELVGPRRLIEGVREGARVVWAPAGAWADVDLMYQRWTLRDSGASAAWAPAHADSASATGEEVALQATRQWSAGVPVTTTLGTWWSQHGGAAVGGKLQLGGERGWQASLARGGRAPRSDEVATAWRHVVPTGRQTVVLPDASLDRERQWRLAAGWAGTLLGLDVELESSWRRLRHGIGWEPTAEDPTVGVLANGVAMDATSVTARVGGQGRFLGWLRWQAEGSWNTRQRDDDLRLALPPELQYRLSALWEQRFFMEDGIVQLGAFWHNRGAMDDPWSWSRPVSLEAVSRLDLIAEFRLVGTSLGVALCNVQGAGARLTANAVNEPLEMRWRLHWTFHY
jgi:hypothetical protein